MVTMVVLPVRWSVRRRLTWIAWAAWVKGRPGRTVQSFMRRISRRPCPVSSVRSLRNGLAPGQGLETAQERGLVALDDEQVVAAGGDDLPGVVVLGVQGVGGDHHAGQVQVGQQGCECGDLVALGLDLPLSYDDLGVVAGGGQQMDDTVRGAAAAQGLAVHGQAGERRPGRGRMSMVECGPQSASAAR
ncbi:hypothetical protein GCM10020219_001120 [Nonomuraea dietziae]